MTLADHTRLIVAALIAALCLGHAPAASAQSAEAEALFQKAKKLLKDGQVAEACDLFEASERIESSVGTLLNLADCREKNGQHATAWAAFVKAAAAAKLGGKSEAKREKEARRRAAVLEPKMAYLTIAVPEANRVDGLTVARNGDPVDPAVWDQAVPIDPGAYAITGQAPGHQMWSIEVTVDTEGQQLRVEVPRVEPIAAAPPPDEQVVAPPPPDGDDDDDAPVASRPGRFTTMRKLSVGVAVLGLAAVGGGIFFGLESSDLESQANERCPEAACNDQMAIDLNEDAQAAGLKANVLIAVGGLAVAGAVAMWFLGAPDEHDDNAPAALAPVLGRDQVGVAYIGRF